MISITDPAYGGVMNDPAIDNWAAFAACIAAACASTRERVVIPAGDLYLTIPGDAVGAQILAGCHVTVSGEGRDITRIIASDATGDSFLLTVAAGGFLTVQDMTAVGPVNNNGFQTRVASHNGTDGSLAALRVATVGYLDPFYLYSGATCDLLIDDCVFDSPGIAPTTCQVGAADVRRVRIYRSDFSGFGLANSTQAHAIYVHQGVDFEVRGCTFNRQYGTGYAIHNFNGTGVSPHAAIADCVFGVGVYQSVLSNPTVTTMISHCRFLDSASSILAQSDCEIDHCVFSAQTLAASPISQVGANAALIRITGCRFDIPNSVYAVNLLIAGSRALLYGCVMSCNAQWACNGAANTTYQVAGDCEFADEIGHLTLKAKQTTPSIASSAPGVSGAGVAGNDMRGYVVFNVTAAIPAGTALFTVAPFHQYSASPYILVTNETADKQAVAFGVSAVGYAGFTVRNLAPLAVGAQLKCAYLAVS